VNQQLTAPNPERLETLTTMAIFPQHNGTAVPTTAPTTDTPTVNTDLPAGHADPGSEFYVPPEARPGYLVDAEEEQLALAVEMAKPEHPALGVTNGPTAIARQRVFDQAYTEARAQALARGEAEHRWPAPEQLSPADRRRQSGIDPMGLQAPRTPDTESITIWQHRRRVDRALRQVAAVREEITRRAAYDLGHTCSTCGQVSAEVSTRQVLHVGVRVCGPCEVLLNAGLVAVLAREQLADRTRGEAVSGWLRDNAHRWAGVQFPAPRGAWSSPTPPLGLGQQRELPTPPPALPRH